jgi:hypothetical protein
VTSASRPSHPPGIDGLREVTERHARLNNEHAKSVANIALPIGAAVAAQDLSDEQRLAVFREVTRRSLDLGCSVGQAFDICRKEARARLEKR